MNSALLHENSPEEIAALLTGRRVEKVDNETLRLDDGRRLRLRGNDGGCSCGSGDYALTELNGVDNVITNVELVNDPSGDYISGAGAYRIFVYANNVKVNLATFEGNDGNGYYGTGYSIEVLGE